MSRKPSARPPVRRKAGILLAWGLASAAWCLGCDEAPETVEGRLGARGTQARGTQVTPSQGGAQVTPSQGGTQVTPSQGGTQVTPALASATQPAGRAATSVGEGQVQPHRPGRSACEAVVVFDRGAAAGSVCADEAAGHGLTVIDLSDAWTPRVFAAGDGSRPAPEYRAKYLELARAPAADLGLYGIAPTLTVLAERLQSPERRSCDAAVDLSKVTPVLASWSTAPDEKARAAVLRAAEARPAIRALQEQLACSGLLRDSQVTGSLGSATHGALDAFRRRHMIVGAGLDDATFGALALGGDELAFRGLLRGLRERVADAAGLIEDGSAAGVRATVVDRELDLSAVTPDLEALEDAAPDLVGAATDAAARALGWTSADEARAFVDRQAAEGGLAGLRVAVRLPEAPSYHSASMDLSVEIDRGDVIYETPGKAAATRQRLGPMRSPTMVLFAKDGDVRRPLLRWSTTIGGWKKERTDEGEIALKYKESDVGDRVWRKLVAAPAWMPPDSTPETDLLTELKDGGFALKTSLVQPGHRSAYGLAMLIHEEARQDGDSKEYVDHAIRTHGSVDFRSIGRGTSHGCHRLHNHLVLRLTGFLLQHRPHLEKGRMRAGYRRTIEWEGEQFELDVPTRGHLYELDPPVPVRVLPGRIIGERQRPVSSALRLSPPEPQRG